MNKKQPDLNIGILGHIAHGKSTLAYSLTKKKTQTHSEELRRGITIRLGYAEFDVYKCKEHGHTTKEKCETCKSKCEHIRKISLVDAPGHETLMATMLSAASIIDGAVIVIAANETCPQPQTYEHLMAIESSGVKNIVIVQNKVDLVSKEEAIKNYQDIKKFVKGTVAEDAPIIPMSAHYKTNLKFLLETIEKNIKTPSREDKIEPIFLTVRTFDVNKPGTDVNKISGGVFGGSIIQGKISVGDEIEIVPGLKEIKKNKEIWTPLVTKVESIHSGKNILESAVSGGNVSLSTSLDPSLTKSDSLAGMVIGLKEKTPEVYYKMDLEIKDLNRKIILKDMKKEHIFKPNEPILLNAWTSKTLGIVKAMSKEKISVDLRIPVAINKKEKVSISKKINNKWRLVGYGIVK